MTKSKKSLAETHPELAKEWHPTLNVIQPTDVTFGSNKKVWWKCPEGDDHEWIGKIAPRASGNRCPICTGKITVLSTSLYHVNPEVASEWHPTKNGKLSPKEISPKSNKKVWWKCSKGADHEWITSPSSKSGCPVCKSKKVVNSNSLATLNPSLANEWHPTLNGELTANNVTVNSDKKVWWKCSVNDVHVWKSKIYNRSRGKGCPHCAGKIISTANSLAKKNPELAKEWNYKLNKNLTPDMIMPGSNKFVWWKCPKGDDHEWKAQVNSRNRGNGCPVCSGQKVVKSNSLGILDPKLSMEWHSDMNKDLTPFDVTPYSHTMVWWQCQSNKAHVWQTEVKNRSIGAGCLICSNRIIDISNSLATLEPEIAKEWHPTLNGDLTPHDVTQGTHLNIWWKCTKGPDHVWQATGTNRILHDTGCPVCSNRKAVKSNSLGHMEPNLALQWHPTKNGQLTPFDVVPGSNKKVWWKCDKGIDHEWQTSPNKRTSGRNCPFCVLTPQSKQELTITFELKTLFKRIDPKGFKTRLDGVQRAIDIFIPKLNLCIEFDGSYWHKGKREIDKIKSNLLLKEGYSVIRVREEPLKKIHDTDVVSKQPYDGKQVTDDILSMILSMYELNSELVQRIKDYQSKGELQNEKGLNRYIDKILKEKAEKK